MGRDPQGPCCSLSLPRGNPTRARRRIAAPGMGRSPGLVIRSESALSGRRGSAVSTLRPRSPPPHNGGVGFFSLARARSRRRDGKGPEGIQGWSLAGPWAVFGLEVWPGSCGYRGGGTFCLGICVRFAHQATTRAP